MKRDFKDYQLTAEDGEDSCEKCEFYVIGDSVWGWCIGSPPIESTSDKKHWWSKPKILLMYVQVFFNNYACRLFKE